MFGNYALASVNGEELPYDVPDEDAVVHAGSLDLKSDWTGTISLTVREGDQELATLSFPGTFTLDESNTLHFDIEDESQKGMWDGKDQITMIIEDEDDLTFIFRR